MKVNHLLLLALLVMTLVVATTATANGAVQLSFDIIKPIILSGEVRVSWSVPSSDDISNDWVSLWWEPVNATYVSYNNVTAHTSSVVFPVLNARHRYCFRYFRGNDSLAQTQWFSPELHVPMHPRLTFVDDNDFTKMRISWTADRVTGKSAVFIGTDPKQVSRVIFVLNQPNYSTPTDIFPPVDTYTREFMNSWLQLPPVDPISQPWPNIGCRCLRCGYHCYDDYTVLRLWADPGFFLNVEVDNLIPGKTYYYQVGEVGGYLSDVRSFVARTPANPDANIRVLYVADGGIFHGALTNSIYRGSIVDNDPPTNGAGFVWDLLKKKIDEHDNEVSPAPLFHSALFNGDLSYARGTHYAWEIFHNQTSRGLFDRIPVMITYGNHERDASQNSFSYARGGDSGGEAGIVAGKRFLLNVKQAWYKRTIGPAVFIGLDTEHSAPEQLKWLQSLEIDHSVTPWVIVFQHRPAYSLMAPDTDTYTHYLEQYGDTFMKLGVDIVLQGHQHQYTRFCPIANEACATWDFRDLWTTYDKSEIIPSQMTADKCFLQNAAAFTSNECRVSCNKQKNCTGIQWSPSDYTCVLLKCAVKDNSQYSWSGKTLMSVARVYNYTTATAGIPYIVDGSAGAEFSTPGVKYDPRVRYTDVKKWGYSTLEINATTLFWQHYHLDGLVADDLILKKRSSNKK